eukprot:scaffold7328_cov314-Pinguiococcus_pyrenoidosus.AAC.71
MRPCAAPPFLCQGLHHSSEAGGRDSGALGNLSGREVVGRQRGIVLPNQLLEQLRRVVPAQ